MAIKRKSKSKSNEGVEQEHQDKKRCSASAEPHVVEAVEGNVEDDKVGNLLAVEGNVEDDKVGNLSADTVELKMDTVSAAEVIDAKDVEEDDVKFLGKPVSDEEARRRWPHRYTKNHNEEEFVQAKHHFVQAYVDGQIYFLEDDAHVQSGEGMDPYICKIIEFFEAVDGSKNFRAQWFYRSTDTVIQTCGFLIDSKRVFFSEIKDDNPLDCLVGKLTIKMLPPKVEYEVPESIKSTCDYYCDMKYLLPFTSYVSLTPESAANSNESGSTISSDANGESSEADVRVTERTLLDLYAGCGAMSTGLCLGANSGGVKLITKWALDINSYACESLKLNHPETEVRNESAQDFLSLMKEWDQLCQSVLSNEHGALFAEDDDEDNDDEEEDEEEDINEGDAKVFEVEKILAICYGDPNASKSPKLHFKIRWKGYGPEEDTWEPLEGLRSCKEKLKEFVRNGHKSRIIPLPGDVDVICGGPPCQGISGFNRFRKADAPLEDEKNVQLIVFMDIVEYLKPRFVLMENVVDIVKFAGGYLGRYGLGRLVSMGYQARMGFMAAGSYGLPQFRMRMFMWGARSNEKLPQYPLPTHNVVVRGNIPTQFEANAVAYEEGQEPNLKTKLFLGDAISDLPPVENDESRDEMPYNSEPQTDFQRFIRLPRNEMPGCLTSVEMPHMLYDHRPLCLNQDDYQRVCQVPKKKGANFRDLPGVRVRPDNKVEWDPNVERVLLDSGKPLVPDYAMTFVRGTSSKPFGRKWWDETVPTVITRAEPHNHAITHPVQDRVLTIRENARLQGFPDYYKLVGPIKERYKQVGNAVAVPVARALGYSLAKAFRGITEDKPVFVLPANYPWLRDGEAEADAPGPAIVMM